MQKFERAKFEVKEYVESDHYGKFVVEPLERGFGTKPLVMPSDVFYSSSFYRELRFTRLRLKVFTTSLHPFLALKKTSQ